MFIRLQSIDSCVWRTSKDSIVNNNSLCDVIIIFDAREIRIFTRNKKIKGKICEHLSFKKKKYYVTTKVFTWSFLNGTTLCGPVMIYR